MIQDRVSEALGRSHRHTVQFYESDSYLCEIAGRFLASGLRRGNPVVVIATPEHVHAFREYLESQDIPVQAAIDAGQFRVFDAREMLGKFMQKDLPDAARFEEEIRAVVESCRQGRADCHLVAYGEMVDVLWREGKGEAAILLEELWNALGSIYDFELLCAYSMKGFAKEVHHSPFETICSRHSLVFPTERYTALSEDARLREISLLQQTALALESEVRDRAATEKHQFFLSAIVDSTEDAIVSKTLDGIVATWNRGAENLFGYSAQEMVGKPISTVIPPDRGDEERWILDKLRRGESIEHYETRRRRKDGEMIDISLTVWPIRNLQGEVIGVCKIARDITKRKRLEAELTRLLVREKTALAEAEAALRLKDEFLNVLSHELRTPLQAIIGWTTILESLPPTSCSNVATKTEELITRALDFIQRSARRQTHLVDDLLDMARLLSGKMLIKNSMVDLPVVIRAAVESVSLSAVAKGLRLDVEIDESVRFLIGDADRLQQMVWNLLGNSIKFTPQGGEVRIQLERSGSNAVITVRDTGQGIAPDFLPYVFDRFRQEDSSLARHHGGLGLGLAVVRYLVEAHGGTVAAGSGGVGKGATFTVRLPFQRV